MWGAAVLAGCGGGGGGTGPTPVERVPLRKVIETRALPVSVGVAAGAQFNRTDAAGTQFMSLLSKEFNVLTPENDMKFGPLRPTRGEFRFARPDSMVEFARANNMKVRGHALVWHQQNPAWLTSGSWTKDQAKAILDEHINGVVGHYKGKIAAWDVVNEAIDDAGAPRSTIWSQTIGPEYIEQAFRTASAADPAAALYYNDYSTEFAGAKQDAVAALLADLKGRGVPVHGVGFQMHLIGGQTPSKAALKQTFSRFAAMGLKIQITELDIRLTLPATTQSLQQQGQSYKDVVEACLETPACDMIVAWGLTDRDSWVPSTFPGRGDALLFDAAFAPKLAYWGGHDALSGK